MPESVKYQRITLRFVSPWNLGNVIEHEWAVKFSLSGAVNTPQADLDATALDLAHPILMLTSAKTSLIGWDHYPIGSATHDYNLTYPKGTHMGDQGGFSAGNAAQQLEVCVLAEAPVGYSTKGRPVYLRKWIHDVQGGPSDPNTIGALTASAAIILQKWNSGSGPHNLVPVSPTTGAQGGPWTLAQHLYTHQLRRGPVKKAKAGGLSLPGLTDLETVIAAYKRLAGATP